MPLPDWARACGLPLFAACIRTVDTDFDVTEILGWDLSGDGEHDYLWIEKAGANTEWVARQLARHAGVQPKDVGYAGLKDRHAIARQWFSVPRWHAPDWQSLDVEGVAIRDVGRHHRKLRRGAHRGNRFRLVLRGAGLADCEDRLRERIALIRAKGVPNDFGEQRFGHDGGNLELADAWAGGKRLPRHQRSLAISTVRSFLFNEMLDARVRDGTWDHLLPGDKANLDGTGSVFDVTEVDDELRRRCEQMDIHPAGMLPGEACDFGPDAWRKALDKARVEPSTRSLRLPAGDLACIVEDDKAIVSLTLGRGAFATAVLREICRYDPDRS